MAKTVKKTKAVTPKASPSSVPAGTPRMLDHYLKTVQPALGKALSRTNSLAIPRLEKIVVNMGVGVAVTEKKYLEEAIGAMAQVTGQKPIATLSKVAVSGFKLRENLPIGCKVTLRKERMYEFLDRLISVAIPRIRDFRGISGKSFDGRGNYNMGVKEQIIFPEIEYEKIDAIRGMNITITTSAKTDEEAKALLLAFKLPLKK